MKITSQILRDANACDGAQRWFDNKFPTGGTKAQVIKACPQGDWLLWGLWNLKLATIEQIIMGGVAAGRLSLRHGYKEDIPVLVAAFDAADAVADDNTGGNRSAAWSAESAAWSAERGDERGERGAERGVERGVERGDERGVERGDERGGTSQSR